MIGVRFNVGSSYNANWALFFEGDANQIGAGKTFALFEYYFPFREATLTVGYADEEVHEEGEVPEIPQEIHQPVVHWWREEDGAEEDDTSLGTVEILLSDDPPPKHQSREPRVYPRSKGVPSENKLEIVSVGTVEGVTDQITSIEEFLDFQHQLEEELPYDTPRRGVYTTVAALDRATPEVRETYRDAYRGRG